MRKKFVTRVVTGALALAMVCTTLLANPVNASAAITRDVIVSNQKQLNRALKLDEVKNITIKTNKAVTLKIGNLVLGDKTLSVNAPKSKIDSKADFKKIMIKDGHLSLIAVLAIQSL